MPLSYSPLKVSISEIRLLTISPGRDEDEIHCSLSTLSLLSRPKYEALSYLWGDPNVTDNIVVDGVAHPVTINLLGVLRSLRNVSTSRVVWVDALCINQTDPTEKNYQIPLMFQIYKGASEVVAWLGSSDSDLEYLASHAHVYFGKRSKYRSLGWIKMRIRSFISKQGKIDKAVLDLRLHSGRMAFEEHPYFSRMWTFQEFLAPVQTPTFLIGQNAFRIDKLPATDYSAVFRGREVLDNNRDRLDPQLVTRLGTRAEEMVRLRENRYLGDLVVVLFYMRALLSKMPSMFDLYTLTWSRNCFDHRDKIFALYGLLQEEHPDLPKPDYTKTPEAVLLELLGYCTKKFNGIYVSLFMCLWPLRASRLTDDFYPSWLPDLTSRMPGRTFVNCAPHYGLIAVNPPSTSLQISDNRTLIIETRIIGTCTRILRFPEDANDTMKMILSLVCPHVPGTTLLQSWEAQLGSRKNLPERYASACYYHDLGSQHTSTRVLVSMYNVIATFESLTDWETRNFDDNSRSLIKLMMESAERLANKTLFQTDRGLFGICSPELEEGDLLVRSPSFPTPLAVSQHPNHNDDDRYVASLVGLAYVDGIMESVDISSEIDKSLLDLELLKELQELPLVRIHLF